MRRGSTVVSSENRMEHVQAELISKTSTLRHVDNMVGELLHIYFGNGDQSGTFSSSTVASAAPMVLMMAAVYYASPLHALHQI